MLRRLDPESKTKPDDKLHATLDSKEQFGTWL